MEHRRIASLFALGAALVACSTTPSLGGGAGAGGAGPVLTGVGGAGSGAETSTSSSAGAGAGGADPGAGGAGGSDASPPPIDDLASNRDRLLGTYFDYLKASGGAPQSNGLSGASVTGVCDLWQKLDPSSQAVFLTLTARMQGSRLGQDDSSMLWHVTKLYRVAGGEGATAADPGSCGGGEFNRMMTSMDAELHDALRAANEHQGAVQGNGKRDIGDVTPSSHWRDSHDAAGPHAPFDLSDETEGGAPRGQVQYFADPASALATSPLGRMDLDSLVDPYALEMDQDYDCVHASNPLCTYVTYGPFCAPQSPALGTEIYEGSYGSFDAGWQPMDCANSP